MKDQKINTELMIERITQLATSKGLSVNKALVSSGAGKSVVDNLKKKSVPSVEKVAILAEYFNVSTDYLLGKTNTPNIPEELKGINVAFYDGAFDGLNDDDIDFLKQTALMLKKKRENNKEK